MRLILSLFVACCCAAEACSQYDDNWISSATCEKWRHLSQDEVKNIRDGIYTFVAPGAGTIDATCLSKSVEFDSLVVLAARGKSGKVCPPIRFLFQRRTALGATEEWEEWAYPSELEKALRQLPSWNILTDPLPIGCDIRLAGWLNGWRDFERNEDFCVCTRTRQGKWSVKIELDWCLDSPFKTGSARPGSMRKSFTSDGVKLDVPSWRIEDGTLDQKLTYSKMLVGADAHTNIWSLVWYSEDSGQKGEKSCKVRFRVWDLVGEKLPKNAKCAGTFCFVLQDGIVKDGSIRIAEMNGQYTVSVKRVRKNYVAEREREEVKITYSKKHSVRYKLPSQIRSVNLLGDKGVIEWDDIDIRYGNECLSLFGSWPLAFALMPLDFTISSTGVVETLNIKP